METKHLPPLWFSGLGDYPPFLVAKIVEAEPNLMFLPQLPPTILAQRFVAESPLHRLALSLIIPFAASIKAAVYFDVVTEAEEIHRQ